MGALPQKFARAARNIRAKKTGGGSSSFRRKLEASPARSTMSSIDGDDFPNSTNENEVQVEENWMVHTISNTEQHRRPIDTIQEQVVIENIPEETTLSSKQVVIENIPEETSSNTKRGKRDNNKRTTSKQRPSKSQLIQEYEEIISKMRTQMSLERRGFAIMALKAKEEKEKMSSQIQDLSWKVTLRGKKVARLEKVVDRCLAEAEQHESTMSVEQESSSRSTNDGKKSHARPQETESENEVKNSKDIENLAELLNHELGRWKSSRDEVASNYDELALAVELKCSKLETELIGFKDMIESLNDFNMLKPTAYGCLCESLAELDKIKSEMRDFITKNSQGYRMLEGGGGGGGGGGDPSLDALHHLRSTLEEKKLYISPGSGSEGSTAATSLES